MSGCQNVGDYCHGVNTSGVRLSATLILLVSSLLVFCSAKSGPTTTERVCQMSQQADTEYFPRGLGTSRVCDSPVSAESVIYEAFLSMGKLIWTFSSSLQWRKRKVKMSTFGILLAFQ